MPALQPVNPVGYVGRYVGLRRDALRMPNGLRVRLCGRFVSGTNARGGRGGVQRRATGSIGYGEGEVLPFWEPSAEVHSAPWRPLVTLEFESHGACRGGTGVAMPLPSLLQPQRRAAGTATPSLCPARLSLGVPALPPCAYRHFTRGNGAMPAIAPSITRLAAPTRLDAELRASGRTTKEGMGTEGVDGACGGGGNGVLLSGSVGAQGAGCDHALVNLLRASPNPWTVLDTAERQTDRSGWSTDRRTAAGAGARPALRLQSVDCSGGRGGEGAVTV